MIGQKFKNEMPSSQMNVDPDFPFSGEAAIVFILKTWYLLFNF